MTSRNLHRTLIGSYNHALFHFAENIILLRCQKTTLHPNLCFPNMPKYLLVCDFRDTRFRIYILIFTYFIGFLQLRYTLCIVLFGVRWCRTPINFDRGRINVFFDKKYPIFRIIDPLLHYTKKSLCIT